MSDADDRIDELYRQPLTEFTAARNGLAKALGGSEGQRVRRLAKPALVPWAINQLYWSARQTYERLMKSGEALRLTQVAALEGRTADVRKAGVAHRAALAEAVKRSGEVAAGAGSGPPADALARMLEALSLSPAQPDAPGRLTEVVQPSGFEALTGVTPAVSSRTLTFRRPQDDEPGLSERRSTPTETGPKHRQAGLVDLAAAKIRQQRREEAEARRREREQAAQRRRAAAAAKAAEQALLRARAAEGRALREYDRARTAVRDAEQALASARKAVVTP